jgi:hypothetical protein
MISSWSEVCQAGPCGASQLIPRVEILFLPLYVDHRCRQMFFDIRFRAELVFLLRGREAFGVPQSLTSPSISSNTLELASSGRG